jgi:hypothetical protein
MINKAPLFRGEKEDTIPTPIDREECSREISEESMTIGISGQVHS